MLRTQEKSKEVLRKRLQLLHVQAQIKDFQKNNPLCFFNPFSYQTNAIELLKQLFQTILFQGSNQIGKTTLGAVLTLCACWGKLLWEDWEFPWEPPIRARILCSDWETHAAKTIVPALYKWAPKGSFTTRKNQSGVEFDWKFQNGSTIDLVTRKQEDQDQEGWTGHWLWCDEPPPKSKYVINKRGLLAQKGIMLLTMTAVYEPWVYEELVEKEDDTIGLVQGIAMRDNPLLEESYIKAFEDSCDEDEVQARLYGGWKQMEGVIFKHFLRSTHAIEPITIDPRWPAVALIDPHLSLPHAIGFYVWDQFGNEYVVDEVWMDGSPREVAEQVIKRTDKMNIVQVLIDPFAKGDVNYMKHRGIVEDTFTQIQRELFSFNIPLFAASKDKESGFRNLKEGIKARCEGAKSGQFMVFKYCERHIREFMHLRYDESGRPMKSNDHFIECAYRSTLVGPAVLPRSTFAERLHYEEVGIV